MRGLVSSLSRRSWWVFAIFIATPAVALAALGIRGMNADEIERQQRVREQQEQVGRLADVALANALERATAGPRLDSPTDDVIAFDADAHDVISFTSDRVFVGPFGVAPASVPPRQVVPTAVSTTVEQAQAAEARNRNAEARALWQTVRSSPDLRPWADLRIAMLRLGAGDRTALDDLVDLRRADSEARTPGGIPVAIVAAGYSADVRARDRLRFVPLIERTLTHLRSGRWWLSIDQRRAYEAVLRDAFTRASDSSPPAADARVEWLARVEPVIRRSRASHDARAELITTKDHAFLVVWSRPGESASQRSGVVLSGRGLTAFFETALRPLTQGQPFDTAVRDRQRHIVWGTLGTPEWGAKALDAMSGWQLVFTGPERVTAGAGRRLASYALVLLPVVMLGSGLVMTAWIVRRDMALARLQATFVAAVTHEFKSPITSIRLLMERIAGGRVAPNESAERYYAAIGAEMDRLEGLVNRLLASQKMQSGQKEYALQPTSLVSLAQTTLERMRPQADARSIRLELQTDGGVPDLPLDRESITDAIGNLVDNAIKYSPSRTQVDVVIQTLPGEVRLDVCDQGIGVESAEAERIFEPFYRSRRGDEQNVHGTGLGLSLVKAAVEAHGGSVEVSSDGRSGSRFTLRLPNGTSGRTEARALAGAERGAEEGGATRSPGQP